MSDTCTANSKNICKASVARSKLIKFILALCVFSVFASLIGLGTWQLKRLQWKLDLIQRVTQRVHAPPVPTPNAYKWSKINARDDEYRHVSVSGKYLYDLTTQVQAVSKLGSGFWVMTPLKSIDGSIVLINRGFIPSKENRLISIEEAKDHLDHSADSIVNVTGLLRMTEPGGAFLRSNDPTNNRWYSRDVHAIAKARQLSLVAPYFIDADATQTISKHNLKGKYSVTYPIAGLTVIDFPNNHLAYALTWYALALLLAIACYWILFCDRKR